MPKKDSTAADTGLTVKKKLKEKNGFPSMLGLEMQKVFQLYFGRQSGISVDIIANWHDIVGDVSAYTVPLKIAFPKGKKEHGVLHIKVRGGAFASMLAYQKTAVIEKVNGYCGRQAIEDIKIIHAMYGKK